MPQKLDGPGDQLTPQNCTNIIYTLANCHAVCFQVFLRENFGEEAFGGLIGPGALVMLLLAAGSDPIMFYYLALWLGMLICQRIQMGINRRKGLIPKSNYNGFPKVAMQLFRCKTETQARMIEPVICLLVGIPLMYYGFEVAGKFISAGAASMWVIETFSRQIDRRKIQQMRDAQIEAERLSAMYKGREF